MRFHKRAPLPLHHAREPAVHGGALSAAHAPAVCRHRTFLNLVSRKPEVGADVFVAPSAAVVGSVTLADKASVWYGTVLRGAQLGATVHATFRAPAHSRLCLPR